MNPGLTKNYLAPAAGDAGEIPPRRIVTWGAADLTVAQAAAASVPLVGVTDSIGSTKAGRCDVYRDGIVEVDYGGVVTRGAPLTSDANGKAVVASAGDHIIGYAELAGVLDDRGQVFLSPGLL